LKILSLESVGTKGLNTDTQPWSLPSEFITDGMNFRIQNDGIDSLLPNTEWIDLGLPSVGYLIPSHSESHDIILIATDGGVYAFDGAVALQVLDAPSDPTLWTYAFLGSVPCLNHPDLGVFYWYPKDASQTFTPLPFSKTPGNVWDASLGKSALAIRSHKNFLFLLNMTEEVNGITTKLSDSYRWSHPATDSGSIPVTWDETDRNFLSGISPIGGDTGAIIDGLSLRDSFVIYSERGINVLDLSGDTFVWNRRQVSTTDGLLARDCVTEANGFHYFMTSTDIIRFDGSQTESIMHKRLRKHYRANLSTTSYKASFSISNPSRKEIWFCIPSGSDMSPTLAYIYNWYADTWALKSLPEGTVHAVYTSRPQTGVTLWQTLIDRIPQPTWEGYGMPWGSGNMTPFDDTVISGNVDGTLWDVDTQKGVDSALVGVAAYVGIRAGTSDAFIERTDYAIEGVNNETTITAAFPKIKGVSPVKIKFGSQDHPGGAVRWKREVIFDPSKKRKVEVRTTGALHAWRIESIGNSRFTFTGMEIQYVNAGER
jgi:hypothetical protein